MFETHVQFYQQAPQEIVSLFSGSRQVVYGFIPNCLQATLKAKIGSKQVETMVSTSDLAVTKGKVDDPTTCKYQILGHCIFFSACVIIDSSPAGSQGYHQRLD